MKNLPTLISILILLHPISGCVWGNKIPYTGTSNFVAPKFVDKLAVGVQDVRPYVLNGDKSEQFVGLTRNLYGMPFGVHTESRMPLSNDLGSLVVETLKKNGLGATQVLLQPKMNAEERIKLLKESKQDKFLLIEIREWKTDGGWSLNLYYDLRMSVIDIGGVEKANVVVNGHDILKSGPTEDLAASVTKVFNKLFSDESVVAALTNRTTTTVVLPSPVTISNKDTTESTTPVKNKCTVEQIIKMNKSGLSEQQIGKACN